MKNRRQIGIITFHRANNYGAVLQNLALINEIKKYNDVEVHTIDYRCKYLEAPYEKNPFCIKTNNLIKKILYYFRKMVNQKNYELLNNGFESFSEKYLNMTESYVPDTISDSIKEMDVFITGSDQVWNDVITNGDSIYSLGFVKGRRTVSYAASAGRSTNVGNKTKKNIMKIDYISVREQELKEYIENYSKKNVELVCDPVFLLSKKEWEGILSQNRKIKDKYIFTYSVSEKTEEVIKIAKKIAKEKNYKIVHLDHSLKYGKKGVKKYGANPLEFVELIRDAEFVIASSFHAVAFSIIFKKNFIVVPTEKTRSRIDNLLNLMNIENRSVDSYEKYIESSMKEETIYEDTKKMKKLIDNSKKFIEESIIQ